MPAAKAQATSAQPAAKAQATSAPQAAQAQATPAPPQEAPTSYPVAPGVGETPPPTGQTTSALPTNMTPGGVPQYVKATEAASVNIPAIPTELQPWISWKRTVRDNVMAASGVPVSCFAWFNFVESPGVTLEQLANSGPFEALDHKLATALYNDSKGDLRRRLTNMREDLIRKGRMMTGRQMLWVINQDFPSTRTPSTSASLPSFNVSRFRVRICQLTSLSGTTNWKP